MTKKETINNVQVLRGIAAILVVVTHAISYVSHFLEAENAAPIFVSEFYFFPTLGNAGVDLFFILSGFIMFYTLEQAEIFRRPTTARAFLVRRFVRIYPIYWFYSLAYISLSMLAACYASDSIWVQKLWSAEYILQSLLLYPAYYAGQIAPALGPGWTLSYELWFYMIIAFALSLGLKNIWMIVIAIIVTLVSLGVFLVNDTRSAVLLVATNPLLIEFLFGIFVGYIWKRNPVVPTSKFISTLFLTFGTLGLFSSGFVYNNQSMIDPSRVIYWGVPAAFIVLGLVILERQNVVSNNGFLIKLGDSSYSLYLCHKAIVFPFVMKLIYQPLELHKWLNGNLLVIGLIGISIIVGFSSYRYLEKPIAKILTGLLPIKQTHNP